MLQLSWDLHLHPGPSAVPRWGDGLRIWEAARAAGVQGFVWKSHEHHTVEDCKRLPPVGPAAIASASLNHWAVAEDVIGAVEAGARWIWGPSQDSEGRTAWDLPLPACWPELREYLAGLRIPVALATSHLAADGRAEFARIASSNRSIHCTVTHSLYVESRELRELGELGSTFEFDLYTCFYPIEGRPTGDLVSHAGSLLERGYAVYLTSDSGQKHVGNPFEFAATALDTLARKRGANHIETLAVEGPQQFVSEVLAPGLGSAARQVAG